jgi:hypothetical protein
MKSISLSILFCILINVAFAQTNSADSIKMMSALKTQGDKMADHLMKNDFKKFSKYTYPKVIAMVGSVDKMIESMEKGFQEMKADSVTFQSVKIGSPSAILKVDSELQCTVPQIIEMKIRGGRLVTNSTLIAISTDKGKNWYFMDTSGKDIETMRKYFPNLSSELVIPAKQKPTFIAN